MHVYGPFYRADEFWRDSRIVREEDHFTRLYHFTIDVVYCLVIWYPGVPFGYEPNHRDSGVTVVCVPHRVTSSPKRHTLG